MTSVRICGKLTGAKQNLTLVFLYQWPLSSRMYNSMFLKLCETYKFRYIAPDRHGFGKHDWTSNASGAETGYGVLAQGMADLSEKLQPGPVVLVAASMGTGEALLAHSKSGYIKANFGESWYLTLVSLRNDRPTFIANSFNGPFGVGLSGSGIFFAADPMAVERCLQIYTSEDLSHEMHAFGKIFNLPFLLIHGGSDGGVPLVASAELVKKLVPKAQLTVYEGVGTVFLTLSYADRLVEDVVNFMESLG
ncbi:Alpha/Beta hydrolase protein [Ilyonectria sp. MPI-CAGE-AT-0026]|nr:Alpha/Beta hydrolase protein [Ilyonectria sp. MPI-CAGE-AT-0026]